MDSSAQIYMRYAKRRMRTLERALPDLDVKEDIPIDVLERLRSLEIFSPP